MTKHAQGRPSIGPSEILPLVARRYPDKVALICDDQRLTYRELDEMSAALAVALRRRGIDPGDVVSLYGPNSWEWIVVYHGVLRAGAVVNPVNVMLTRDELRYVLSDCQAKALFVGAAQLTTAMSAVDGDSLRTHLVFSSADRSAPGVVSLTQLIEDHRDDQPPAIVPQPTDLCSIGYTSGTTGHPKGVMQSHQSVLLNCALAAAMHGRTANDVLVTALPTTHVYGNVAVNSIFLAGGTVVLMERFDPATTLDLINREHATMFEGVPAMYAMLLSHPSLGDATWSSLRCSTVGGQTMPVSTLEAWQERTGAPLLELWGMTELSGLGATHGIYSPPAPGSIGISLPGLQLRVTDLSSGEHELTAGERGELQVRGPLVMLGYFARPEATSEVLRSDGWLRTGDVAYADESGHIFVVDRVKDVILTAGYNVYPAEIERVIGTHPDVDLVAVGRRADDVRGEIAVAYVVPRGGVTLTEDGIIDFCRDKLAAYKRPRAVVFTDALPMTSSGKIMRRKLIEFDPRRQISDVSVGD